MKQKECQKWAKGRTKYINESMRSQEHIQCGPPRRFLYCFVAVWSIVSPILAATGFRRVNPLCVSRFVRRSRSNYNKNKLFIIIVFIIGRIKTTKNIDNEKVQSTGRYQCSSVSRIRKKVQPGNIT